VNFPERPAIPAILFQHNVESEIWRRHVVTESNWARKLMYRVEFAKMLRYEQRIVRKFDHVIAVSEHDRNLMNRWVDASRLTVVPTGVDLQQFHPDPSAKAQEPVVMFVGAMDWEPNIDAVEYFCGEIWSGVQARVAGARLRIVGRNPNRRIQKLASSSIEVTGAVPSIGDHLREAAVVVVPLRVGGGTRLKIYEAMAMGKAVVSTSVGAEGLDVHHGRDIVLADTSSTFAEVVVSLLENADLRNRYGRAAAQTASQFGWPVIARKFGNVLETIAGGQRPIVAAAEQRLGGMTSTRGQGVI
jgi:glycosyltransferase involved in cell wall biosynthesis